MGRVDYYAVLGVGPEAETEVIRQAYERAIAKARQAETVDTDLLSLIETAGAVLLNPITRAEYDARCVGHDVIEETTTAIVNRFARRR